MAERWSPTSASPAWRPTPRPRYLARRSGRSTTSARSRRAAPTTTPASDVYGLGLVLYEMLTGTRAFGRGDDRRVALARVGAAAPSPKAIRPEVPAELDAAVRQALAPDAEDRYPNGDAMATALEAAVQATDDASPTTVVATPAPRRRRGAATAEPVAVPEPARVGDERPVPKRPRRSTTSSSRSSESERRRSAPSGVVVALLALLGIAGGAMFVAALPGVERPVRTELPSEAILETPTAEPTPSPTPTPSPEPTPTAAPTATAVADRPPARRGRRPVRDLLRRPVRARRRSLRAVEIPAGLRHRARRRLVECRAHRADAVALTRGEGTVTFAGEVRETYPDGETDDEPRARARDLMGAFMATEGVRATDPANVRIDGRRGLSSDLVPADAERVALFSTEGSTFYLEPGRTTRMVVIDLPGEHDVPDRHRAGRGHGAASRSSTTADPAAGTIRWR